MTNKEAPKATRWYQRVLGIQDWKVELYIQNEPPPWVPECTNVCVGKTEPIIRFKKARVWVSPSRAAGDTASLLDILFHELTHMVLSDIGLGSYESEHTEYTCDRLAGALARLYRSEFGY